MKQQEILRKIGNILKELNEQYEYLQAEDAHLNDLELELFAANAKFLTDHNEILRKINMQAINTPLVLPQHAEPAALSQNATPANVDTLPLLPETQVTLPGFSESAVAFTDDEPNQQETAFQEPVVEPIEEYAPQPDPVFINYTQSYAEPEQEEPASSDQEEPEPSIYSEPYFVAQEENTHHEHIQEPKEDETFEPEHLPVPSTADHSSVEEFSYTTATPAPITGEDHEHEQQGKLSIGNTEEKDSYGFLRREPEISNEDHSFSVSSYTEDEPKPPHIDLTPAQPDFHHTEEIKQPEVSTPVPEELPITQYAPSVTETLKHEPEQPLTLNERLSTQLHPHTPSHAQQGPAITDIKAAISMNDKLLFVKDLFNGYGMAYTEAIELLNRCKNFDEADRFLKTNYVVKNSWGDKPNTVDKFYAVLHRRFTS